LTRRLVIGTRGSRLALIQARMVSEALAASFPDVEITIREITTSGDRDRSRAISAMGETGVFTREIERALLAGEIDLAVHSLKDLPVEQPEGVVIAATPTRADARDTLICARASGLAGLPEGAKVGTSSPRRSAQLLRLRADLDVQPIRGNVDTRLAKVADGDYDAVVVAKAALDRLGCTDAITEIFEPDAMLPAPGQGALAAEIRDGDLDVARCASTLNDTVTFVTTGAERALLARLGGGCHLPLGALAQATGEGSFRLQAVVAAADGSRAAHAKAQGALENPSSVVDTCYQALLDTGAAELI